MTAMSTYWIILIFLILGVLTPTARDDGKCSTYCKFYNKDLCSNVDQEHQKCVLNDPTTRNGCFIIRYFENSTNEITVQQKGCVLDGTECCEKIECVNENGERKKNVFFCCCSGDTCDEQFTWNPKCTKAAQANLAIIVSLLTVPRLLIIVLVLLFLYWKHQNSKNLFDEKSMEQPKYPLEPYVRQRVTKTSLDQIDKIKRIADGNFGTVWKARMADDIVAVKVFRILQERSWRIEQKVFKLPQMNHPNLLEFIGAIKKHDELRTELRLVVAYHEKGSLYEYLKANVLSWSQLCKIAESMFRGLAHLHEEIPANKVAGSKPAVAHRDIKSQNILLKSDMSACIADFGLSLIFHPDKPTGNKNGQAGTRRYMAPEVLQETVNFDRDSFLRVDIYACGFVLWELATRCTAINAPVEKYRLPFHQELGFNPTTDDMLNVIVHKGIRPKVLPSWRNHPGLLAFCNTMEECWDTNPQARPSAACALSRVLTFDKTLFESSSTSPCV